MYEQCQWANGDTMNFGGVDHAGVLLLIQTVDGNIIGGALSRLLCLIGGAFGPLWSVLDSCPDAFDSFLMASAGSGFCDRKLEPFGGGVKYCGRRGCFVFVFTPGLEVEAKAYRWSGLNEMFWRMLEPQGTLEQRQQGKARPASVSLGGGTDSNAGA